MSKDLHPHTVQHRLCQQLHAVYGSVALLAGCGLLLEQPVMWLFVLPLAVLVAGARRLARRWAGAALRRRGEREDIADRAHAMWGAAAAVLDASLVAGSFAISTLLLLGHGEALVLRGRTADYVALGAGAAFAGAHALTHHLSALAPKAQTPPEG
ncbi:hypothetical protein [Streptomyces sp. NPDC059611]|uniref:hypothetical protein n=1 Tax=Streptomyces sp. NPDC059611 TaxID=3346884 RepID=UPI003691A259